MLGDLQHGLITELRLSRATDRAAFIQRRRGQVDKVRRRQEEKRTNDTRAGKHEHAHTASEVGLRWRARCHSLFGKRSWLYLETQDVASLLRSPRHSHPLNCLFPYQMHCFSYRRHNAHTPSQSLFAHRRVVVLAAYFAHHHGFEKSIYSHPKFITSFAQEQREF